MRNGKKKTPKQKVIKYFLKEKKEHKTSDRAEFETIQFRTHAFNYSHELYAK